TTNGNYYEISDLSEGTHTLAVDATFEGGTSAAVSGQLNIVPDYPGVGYVHIKAEGDTKLYSYWAAPVDDDDTWVSYSTGKAASGIYGPESNNYGYMAGVVYTPSMLKGYNNYEITSFSFYPTADALFTFYLLEGNNNLLELEVDDYVLNQWNVVKLPTPIRVNERSSYTLALDCYDVTAEMAPLAIDDAPAHMFYSDLYSLDGESWNSFYDTGVNGNWMLGWNMKSPNGQPMTVSGYDVRIDGTKVNDALLTAPEFRYDFGSNDGATHNLTVDTYFPGYDKAVGGDDNYFTIGVDGIDNAKVKVLDLTGNSNFLRAEGEGVKSIEAYNVAGAVVASAKGNTLNISSFANGIYVVKIDVAGKAVTRKIEIRK
ncbi:MAG: T9SS type A sorting domain-containing protein, partial [Prevotella sp.]